MYSSLIFMKGATSHRYFSTFIMVGYLIVVSFVSLVALVFVFLLSLFMTHLMRAVARSGWVGAALTFGWMLSVSLNLFAAFNTPDQLTDDLSN